MFKDTTICVLVASLIFARPLFADLILLKSGGIMRGEILSESESAIKIKDKSGTVEDVNPKLVTSVVKDKELLLNPEETYEQRARSISDGDARAHHELGLFCVRNYMLDYALKEFNKAREIDPNYEKLAAKEIGYIESVNKKADEIRGNFERFKEERLPLSADSITSEFKKGGLAIPSSHKDVETIVGVVNSLSKGNEKEKQRYAEKYLELGGDYEKRLKEGVVLDAYSQEALNTALFCYEIAYSCARNSQTSSSAQQKIIDINNRTRKMQEAQLPVPHSVLDRDAIILCIRGSANPADKNSFYAIYYYKGAEFKAKVKGKATPLKEEERKNLETALYCYEIAKSAYPKEILTRGLIEASIKECEELLGKMKKLP